MKKVKVVSLGVEGGGATIYGWQVDGAWWFQQEGSSICLDENNDEAWGSWGEPAVTELGRVLPDNWLLMIPYGIHPEFVSWFLERCEAQRKTLSGHEHETRLRYTLDRWQSFLAGQLDAR